MKFPDKGNGTDHVGECDRFSSVTSQQSTTANHEQDGNILI